jgi:hypothetical protein
MVTMAAMIRKGSLLALKKAENNQILDRKKH